MANKKELQDLQRLLKDINRQYKALGQASPFEGMNIDDYVKGFNSVKDATNSATISLKAMRAEVAGMETGLDGLRETFRDISKELGNAINPLKSMTKGFNKIKGLAQSLNEIQDDLSKSSLAQVKTIQRKVDLEFQRLKRNVELLKVQHEQLHVERAKLKAEGQSTKSIDIKLGKASELLAFAEDEAKILEEKVGYQQKFNAAIEKTLSRVKNIKAATGLTGSIIKSLGGAAEKIGFGDMSDTLSGITDKMADHAAHLTDNGKNAASLGDQFKIMGQGLAGLGSALMDQLTDPLVIITMIVKAVKFLVGIFSHVLKVTNKIGQSVGVAGKEAENLKKQIHAVGDLSGDMFYNTEEMTGAYIKLNKAAGTNLKFNAENAKTFQDLTLYMGVSEEGAAELFKLSASTGKSYQGMYTQVRDVTQSLNESSGYSMSTQDAIEAIAQSSGTVRFNIKGGTEGLVKAAHTAARLGLTMADIAAAAETHLDFESSIQKEIEAEMYLQKDLNLDKLRYAALTGNTAMAAEEEARLIKENYKSLKGNVLAQQAFAAATGISMDKLGGAMENQKKLAGLTGQELKDKLATEKTQKELGQDAVAFDRTMANLALQFKAMLEPLAKTIGPMIMGIAKTLGPLLKGIGAFASSGPGKLLLGLAGVAVGIKVASGVIGKMKSFFGLGGGALGSSPMHPMHVTGGGGGGDSNNLTSMLKGNIFKYLGKKGGLSRTMNRTLIRAFGRNGFTKMMQTKVFNPLGKSSTMLGRGMNNLFGKIIPQSGANLTKAFGTNQMNKIQKMSQTGRNAAGQFISKAQQAKAGSMVSKFTTGAPGIASKAGAFLPKAVTSTLTKTMGVASKALKVLGPVGVAADLVLGGVSGYGASQMSAEEQKAAGVEEGISATKATTLGVLTGGAEKGSMFSSSLGIEKGSAGDEAMGIAGAAGRGALTGAAIGSFIPVVGTAVGAAVGGLIGGVSETFKVFSDPDSSLRKWTGELVSDVGDFASESLSTMGSWASSAGEGISSFFSSVGSGVSSLASGAADMASEAGSFLANTASSVGSSIANSSIGKGVSSAYNAVANSSFNPMNWWAEGGVITKPTLGVAGESGPEAIIPLNQAGDILGSTEVIALLKELISTVNKGGNVYLDGAKVGYTMALQSSKMG